jgi:exonuclease III
LAYECVWVRLVKAEQILSCMLIASVYIPPASRHRTAAVVRDRIERLCSDVVTLSASAAVVVCGDFN